MLDHTLLLHRPVTQTRDDSAVKSASMEAPNDALLVRRIISAYRLSANACSGAGLWHVSLAPRKRDVHDALLAGDEALVAEQLRNPAGNELFFGFEALYKSGKPSPEWLSLHARLVYNELLCLAEATAAIKLWNPETDSEPPLRSVDEVLALLDNALGFPVIFPNPYPEEYGLASSRGIASLRSIDAIYQAWRIWTLVEKNRDARVLEIGGGLGRVAYYARRFGVRSYTIIDIPLGSVAQAYYLGRTCGDAVIELEGEASAAPIKLKAPAFFLEGQESYDLVLNSDSFPEIDDETTGRYAEAIKQRGGRFLSMNHEHYRLVRDIMGVAPVYRSPYWIRRGYVEELFEPQRESHTYRSFATG
jgi:SAM-dependent methyltransferase